MRITGGEFCGRVLKVPKTGDVRPTQDRVREALFSMLQREVQGARVLDLFAGTGAVGLEALSRGAAYAEFVEINPKHLAVLAGNLSAMVADPSRCRVVRMDAYRYVEGGAGTGFDIVFADPPYRIGEEMGYSRMLASLAERSAVAEGGIFVAEMTAAQPACEADGWDLVRDRAYGKTRIVVWRRKGESRCEKISES